LLLRAGTSDELPFAHTVNGAAGSPGIDRGSWLVAEVVFDKVSSERDFQKSSYDTRPARGAVTRRVSRLYQANISRPEVPLVATPARWSHKSRGWALGYYPRGRWFCYRMQDCVLSVVAATGAGWSNCLSLFEAALSRLPSTYCQTDLDKAVRFTDPN
jgi:hypothetical protein